MSWAETQLEQNTAIRRALGVPEDTEVIRTANGWTVNVAEATGRTAIELAKRIGERVAIGSWTADEAQATHVRTGDDTLILHGEGVDTPDGFVLTSASIDGDTATRVLAEGDHVTADDRERYVTARAEQLARAFDGTLGQDRLTLNSCIRVFRALIDRGMLK